MHKYVYNFVYQIVEVLLGLQSKPVRQIESHGSSGDSSHDFSLIQLPSVPIGDFLLTPVYCLYTSCMSVLSSLLQTYFCRHSL